VVVEQAIVVMADVDVIAKVVNGAGMMGASAWFFRDDDVGVPGVNAGFLTVVGMAEIISFWSGFGQFRKCFKINACIWPNFTGFLAR